MVSYFKQRPNLLFLLFLIALFFLNRYEEISFLKPYSTHQWRQADCYSFALNYYHHNLPFLEPSVHFTGFNGNGKTISEFPIIYYTIAKLWSIFGLHPFIFRLFNLTVLFCGLFSLFKLCTGIFNNSYIALFITGMAVSSPIVLYYGNNFIADIPALSLAYCGWYAFYLFYKKGKQHYLYLTALIFLMAALIKITSLVSVIVLFVFWLVDTIGLIKLRSNGHKIFDKPVLQVVPICIIFITVFCWVQYVKDYNAHNNQGIFLTGILPYWDASIAEKETIYAGFLKNVLFQYHNPIVLAILVALILVSLICIKQNHALLSIAVFMLIIALSAFIVLFFRVFDVHDYYLSNWTIIIPTLFIAGLYSIQKVKPFIFQSKIVISCLVLLFLYSMYYGAALTRAKYFTNDTFSNMYLTFGQVQRQYYNWFHWNYNTTLKACESIEPYLDSIGIKIDDKIISIPDQSINISLALMNRNGFTDFGYNNLSGEVRINEFISQGAKYLIINDSDTYERRTYLSPFLKHEIGTHKNIRIFDLTQLKK